MEIEREVSETLKIASSLAIISSLIGLAIIFGILGRHVYYSKVDRDAKLNVISQQAELVKFVSPDDTVTGVDIMDFITNHNSEYKYRIITDSSSGKVDTDINNPYVQELIRNNPRHKGVTAAYYNNGKGYSYEVASNIMWSQTYLNDVVFARYDKGSDGKYIVKPGEYATAKFKSYATLEYDIPGNRYVKKITNLDDLTDYKNFVYFNFELID